MIVIRAEHKAARLLAEWPIGPELP